MLDIICCQVYNLNVKSASRRLNGDQKCHIKYGGRALVMSNELSNRLRELRARCGWTQEVLANKVAVTRQTIIAIEKEQHIPSAVLALKIANAFQLPLEEVFWLNGVTQEEKAASRHLQEIEARGQ